MNNKIVQMRYSIDNDPVSKINTRNGEYKPEKG